MPRGKRKAAPKTATVHPGKAMRAFEALRADLSAYPSEKLVPPPADAREAVTAMLGALPTLREFAEAIAERIPAMDPKELAELEGLAMALWHAQSAVDYAEEGAGQELDAAKEEAQSLREDLLVAAEALAHRKHLDPERVSAIRASADAPAQDLVELAEIFDDKWLEVSTKTAAERVEVDRAAELGPLLLIAEGAGEPGADGESPYVALRDAAFSHLNELYEEWRRGLAYLRWYEGDAQKLAPPLVNQRKQRRRKTDRAEATSEVQTPAPPAAESGATAESSAAKEPVASVSNDLGVAAAIPAAAPSGSIAAAAS